MEEAETEKPVTPASAATRERLPKLDPSHMPKDYAVSLAAYRRGGTDRFLDAAPEHLVKQPMRGFEPAYVNIIDYIVRITHRIWEEKDIGYIYDTYSHDANVWDDFGLQYGRDKIVADTVHTNNAFPDIRLVADEVIWAGDAEAGFHTSHRAVILGHNTGYSRFGPPTGRRVNFWCIANCVVRDNEIFQEHVLYNTTGMIQQLGLDLFETARRLARAGHAQPRAANFDASEPVRLPGQGKPAAFVLVRGPGDLDVDAFARSFFQNVWNRRNLSALDLLAAPNVVVQAPTGRVYQGVGRYKSFVLSMLAMFPDLAVGVDEVYWMGNAVDGYLASVRWSAQGTHRGHGVYGEPTGRETHLWGITQWSIQDGVIDREWMMFNELGVLMQLLG